MKDPKHTPLYVNFATKLRDFSTKAFVWINSPPQCLWGTFNMDEEAANEPKEKEA